MGPKDAVDLGRVDEHAADLGPLIRPAEPSPDAGRGAPAGALPRQDGREIAGGEAEQRIVLVEKRDHHLAHLPVGQRGPGPGTQDFDDDVLVQNHAFPGLGFIGDQPDIRGAVGLQDRDAAVVVFLSKRRQQRPAADRAAPDRRDIRARLVRLVENDLEEIGRAGVAVGPVISDRLDLAVGLAGAARDDRTSDGRRGAVEHHAGRREMVGKAVQHDVARAETGGMERAGHPPVIRASALGVGDRPGREKEPRHPFRRQMVEPAEGRRPGLAFDEVALADNR